MAEQMDHNPTQTGIEHGPVLPLGMQDPEGAFTPSEEAVHRLRGAMNAAANAEVSGRITTEQAKQNYDSIMKSMHQTYRDELEARETDRENRRQEAIRARQLQTTDWQGK